MRCVALLLSVSDQISGSVSVLHPTVFSFAVCVCVFFLFLFLPFWKPLTMGIPTDNCSPRPQAPPTLIPCEGLHLSQSWCSDPSTLRSERLVRSPAVAGSGAGLPALHGLPWRSSPLSPPARQLTSPPGVSPDPAALWWWGKICIFLLLSFPWILKASFPSLYHCLSKSFHPLRLFWVGFTFSKKLSPKLSSTTCQLREPPLNPRVTPGPLLRSLSHSTLLLLSHFSRVRLFETP